MEFLPELIGISGIGIVSWFANRMTTQLDRIHDDLRGFSERVAKLEAQAHGKQCPDLSMMRQ